ncbi:hypothetical protein MNBD_NITROSPINAE01-1290 [hydrothermal vent metagenome]|uniref:Cobalt transporter subunit CbtB n=1 Tax=hydrothermal vent metagenome TaxID=652676 RepID=A0A3B1CYC2_9ZZZZ
MENIIRQNRTSQVSIYVFAGIILSFTFMAITVAYGLDGIIMGVHDMFHDFRHVMGMPCH